MTYRDFVVGSVYYITGGIVCCNCRDKQDWEEDSVTDFTANYTNGMSEEALFLCEECGVRINDAFADSVRAKLPRRYSTILRQ